MLSDQPLVEVITRWGRATSDPTRTRILLLLLNGPLFPTDLALLLKLTRQSVSNHLAFLRECKLVAAKRVGRQVSYALASPSVVQKLADLLQTMAADSTGSPTA